MESREDAVAATRDRFRGRVALDGRFVVTAYRAWTVTLGVEAAGQITAAATGAALLIARDRDRLVRAVQETVTAR